MPLDWGAFILCTIALFLLRVKDKRAFLLGIIVDALWFWFGYEIGSIAVMLMNVVFFGMHVSAYLKWRKDEGGA